MFVAPCGRRRTDESPPPPGGSSLTSIPTYSQSFPVFMEENQCSLPLIKDKASWLRVQRDDELFYDGKSLTPARLDIVSGLEARMPGHGSSYTK